MSMASSTEFDLARFARATEERDASTQLSMYATDAVLTVVDRNNQPGSPMALRGRDEIKQFIEELTGRDMIHRVQHTVRDDNGAAYTVACRYPDGTNVLCATVLELQDGLIARQTVVQVWDED